MLLYQSIILGIIQGLTELLPISSSAHLYLIPWIFNWNISESFDVALHFGTFLAIIIFFFKDWINLIKGRNRGYKKKEKCKWEYFLVFSNSYNTRCYYRVFIRSLLRKFSKESSNNINCTNYNGNSHVFN